MHADGSPLPAAAGTGPVTAAEATGALAVARPLDSEAFRAAQVDLQQKLDRKAMHALCELTPMTTDIIEAVGTVQKLLREQVFATLEEEEKIFMHQSGNNKGQERFRLSDGFMLETDRNKAANFVKVCGTWYLPRLAVVGTGSYKLKVEGSCVGPASS
jgi:hypothetical protein